MSARCKLVPFCQNLVSLRNEAVTRCVSLLLRYPR